jgi:hemolysin III
MTSSITAYQERPSWRGWMHVAAFALAIPGGVFLLMGASGPAAVVAASIYTASLLLGFGTSAGYHRLARQPRTQRIMQRMDHSMIFVLIAGSYTPVCLLGLPPAWGIPLLCAVWAGALAGVLIKLLAFERFKALEYALYPGLGWALVVATPVLLSHMNALELSFLLAGGVLYTVGIPVLVRERPNPWPQKFGYHEIWHGFTVAAGACHFATMGMLIRA